MNGTILGNFIFIILLKSGTTHEVPFHSSRKWKLRHLSLLMCSHSEHMGVSDLTPILSASKWVLLSLYCAVSVDSGGPCCTSGQHSSREKTCPSKSLWVGLGLHSIESSGAKDPA